MMNSFFHAYTKKYYLRRRYAMLLTAAPVAELSLFLIWAAFFNLRQMYESGALMLFAVWIGVAVAAAMILFIFYAEITEKKVRRHSKYTYFDIAQKVAVYSRYAGEYSHLGEKIIRRRLCVMRLGDFQQAYLDEKKKHLILVGKIRVYEDESSNLGYHISDGDLVFDNWWYNETGFREIQMIRLPVDFEKPSRIARRLYLSKREFEKIPEKKPYVFVESEIVKKRRELKRLKEEMRYERKW